VSDLAYFIANARVAIEELRAFNVPDVTIACVLCGIRAAAIHEERLRVSVVLQNNPPKFPTFIQMLNETLPASREGGEDGI
jgi:hypothetical protein